VGSPNITPGIEALDMPAETMRGLEEAIALREFLIFASGRGEDAVGQLNFL
jgi:hypothetical protein